MIREIVKDQMFLARKSEIATAADLPAALDLMQTLAAHSDGCVGMAGNMIGVLKRIIAYVDQESGNIQLMFNPVIVKAEEPYETEEGCLSLPGVRKTTRYRRITVEYQDGTFKKKKADFKGFTAQIIQHEVDMTNGILI